VVNWLTAPVELLVAQAPPVLDFRKNRGTAVAYLD
jgi:hypothetical protein